MISIEAGASRPHADGHQEKGLAEKNPGTTWYREKYR
jgi:hypothetical protein